MDEREEIIKANMDEYFELADAAFRKGKYNSAATLFFKAMCAAADLFILKKEGQVPSSHTHRFRLAQERHPELYNILDRDFTFYQDSHTKKVSKESAEVLRDDSKRIKKMLYE
jgi:hypothetical protein